MNMFIEVVCFVSGAAFIWFVVRIFTKPSRCASGTMMLVGLTGLVALTSGTVLVRNYNASWQGIAFCAFLAFVVAHMFMFDYNGKKRRQISEK